jgi:hypothetical protein
MFGSGPGTIVLSTFPRNQFSDRTFSSCPNLILETRRYFLHMGTCSQWEIFQLSHLQKTGKARCDRFLLFRPKSRFDPVLAAASRVLSPPTPPLNSFITINFISCSKRMSRSNMSQKPVLTNRASPHFFFSREAEERRVRRRLRRCRLQAPEDRRYHQQITKSCQITFSRRAKF